jgi:hypothetical protein
VHETSPLVTCPTGRRRGVRIPARLCRGVAACRARRYSPARFPAP